MSIQTDGFLYRYSVKETPDRGRAVFAEEAIPKGALVWRHVPGQYAVYDEAGFKARLNGMAEADIIYELTHMFGLADFPNCVIRVFDAGVLFNHSTEHTLATNNAAPLERPLDPTLPTYIADVTEALLSDRYAMVAVRDIDMGDEFTNDYMAEVGDPPFFEALYDRCDIDHSFLGADA